MRGPVRFALVVAVAALVLPPPSRAQWPGDAPRASVAPAFSGRYKLVLTFGRAGNGPGNARGRADARAVRQAVPREADYRR